MLQGKRNYTSLTTKTRRLWQQQAGGCQIVLLPRRCYQRIEWLLPTTSRIKSAWKKFHELIPKVFNKRFSQDNRGHIYNSCV